MFEEIHINKMLHILVFGESLLNGASQEREGLPAISPPSPPLSLPSSLSPPPSPLFTPPSSLSPLPYMCTMVDAVTIVLFQVLGAFANRPFDPTLDPSDTDITVADVSSIRTFTHAELKSRGQSAQHCTSIAGHSFPSHFALFLC